MKECIYHLLHSLQRCYCIWSCLCCCRADIYHSLRLYDILLKIIPFLQSLAVILLSPLASVNVLEYSLNVSTLKKYISPPLKCTSKTSILLLSEAINTFVDFPEEYAILSPLIVISEHLLIEKYLSA